MIVPSAKWVPIISPAGRELPWGRAQVCFTRSGHPSGTWGQKGCRERGYVGTAVPSRGVWFPLLCPPPHPPCWGRRASAKSTLPSECGVPGPGPTVGCLTPATSAGAVATLFLSAPHPPLTHSETALPRGFLASEFTFGLVSARAAQSSFVFKCKPTELLSPFSDPPKQTKDVGLHFGLF